MYKHALFSIGDYEDSGSFDGDDEGADPSNIRASADSKAGTVSSKPPQKPDLPILA